VRHTTPGGRAASGDSRSSMPEMFDRELRLPPTRGLGFGV
jgi:hypothetical protein